MKVHDHGIDYYLGYTHFKLLIGRVDDFRIWSAGSDETHTLRV